MTKREAAILDREWTPWEKPLGLQLGLLTAARPSWIDGLVTILSGLDLETVKGAVYLFAMIWGIWGFIGALFAQHWLPLLLIPLSIAAIRVFHVLEKKALNGSAMAKVSAERAPSLARALVYTGPIPSDIWRKYQRDHRLFDHVYIGSFEDEAFGRSPRPLTCSAYLVGRWRGTWYIGGKWRADRIDVTRAVAEPTG